MKYYTFNVCIILHTIKRRKANSIGHNLRSNSLLKHVLEGRLERKLQVTGRQGRKHDQLLDDLKETRGYRTLKKAALDHTVEELWKKTHY
jgi:hypothetical protein